MAEQDSERTITKIPLQENKTLEITDQSILIYSNDKVLLAIPIQNVRSIVPSKESGIAIHYTKEEIEPNLLNYETERCKLATKLSPSKLCKGILQDLIKQDIVPENNKGLFYLRPNEHIVHAYHKVSTGGCSGLLCVTNLGIVHELDSGVLVDILYDQMVSVEKSKKNIIIIEWEHLLPVDDNVFSFDLVIPKEIERDLVYLSIKKESANTMTPFESNFSLSGDHYSNLDHKKMYKLAQRGDPDFYQWIENCSKFVFGSFAPEFADVEDALVLACKINNWNVDLISSVTTQENLQRRFAKRQLKTSKFVQENLGKYQKEVEILNKFNSDSDRVRANLENNREFLELYEKLILICNRNSEFIPVESCVNKMRAESLRYYDKRVDILYDKWCRDEPLQVFADEYDDEWIKYLLKRLKTPRGRKPLGDTCLSYDELRMSLSFRDARRRALEDFSAPKDIDQKYIYNNCWYDNKQKMWYVQDDYINEEIEHLVDSDLIQSEKVIGRQAWGFKNNKVKMFCGFPSVLYDSDVDDFDTEIFTSRKTGQLVDKRVCAKTHHILPILRDDDITEEMEKNLGSVSYESDEIQCAITSSGSASEHSPKMLHLSNMRYGFPDVPINERVRRALFCIDTGLFFNPESELGSYMVYPKTYPDTFYDERFE